ncbi:MAG: type II secretion system ATPase GspE [Sedimentisphaerales bacterium]|nr:type II secretion system ATPase GspE [Sedimentisphaerales bacterium]
MDKELQGQVISQKRSEIPNGDKCVDRRAYSEKGGNADPDSGDYLDTISPEQLNPELVRKLPLEFLKSQCAIPIILEDGRVAIALADALNVEAYDAILSILAGTQEVIKGLWGPGQQCSRITCPASEIEKAISRCYYHQNTSAGSDNDNPEAQALMNQNSDTGESGIQTHAEDLLNIANKAPIVKLVNNILFQAVHRRASDIHIEPYEHEARVRFRIDGVLRDVVTLPKQQIAALLSRLKIMANLNIAERRLPQDGQSRIKIGRDLVDIRVSVIPTLGGERVMLRLLDKSRGQLGLEQVGFSPEMLSYFRNLINLPHGIILLTGPTGSGKTTTLYAALNELNCEERNILTVEDPIEYQLPGIGQMQVKPKINLTFASCFRHILRQDPDVIMIGEIRDLETAEIAIQASLTGHLVLSTLHTNDSASAITRLIDMGIEPYLISSSVIAVMAQRLIRVICPHCKSPYGPQEQMISLWSEKEKASLVRGQFYKGSGCENCVQTGYMGRTGILELLVIDDEIKELTTTRACSHVIKQVAVEKGMSTLREDGLRKAMAGETTLEEVCRVTQDSVHTNLKVGEHVGG